MFLVDLISDISIKIEENMKLKIKCYGFLRSGFLPGLSLKVKKKKKTKNNKLHIMISSILIRLIRRFTYISVKLQKIKIKLSGNTSHFAWLELAPNKSNIGTHLPPVLLR